MTKTPFAFALVVVAACGSDNGNTPDAAPGIDAPPGSGLPANFFPAPAPAFSDTTNTARTVKVQFSGEQLALTGFPYTKTPSADQLVFVDGWEISFQHVYVSISKVRLNEIGANPSDFTSVGAKVAEKTGPWLVDLARAGTVTGTDGEAATAGFIFTGPDAGGQFETTKRYAFSFETIAPSSSVQNVNLVEADDRTNAEEMLATGWTHLLIGTGTYRGDAGIAGFASYPTEVSFHLGFGIPAEYRNCHNPSIGADAEDPANRGIQPSASGAVTAQATLHQDHSFWDTLEVEGTPLRFDPLAARASNFGTTGSHALVLSDLMGVNPTALKDRTNAPVGDRGTQTTGYDPSGSSPPPAYNLNSVSGVADFRDFFAYLTRGQGHLNADGECVTIPGGPFKY